MELLTSNNHHFKMIPDGTIWTITQFPYSFWTRYLDAFAHVRVLARAQKVPFVDPEWHRVDGNRVTVVPIPDFYGPEQLILKHKEIIRAIRESIKASDAIILRLPSLIGTLVQRQLITNRHPYGAELVGDPFDVFSPGAMNHPLRPLFRWWSSKCVRREVNGAVAVSYVTQKALQRRYPGCKDSFTINFSDIMLHDDDFACHAKTYDSFSATKTIIHVGAMEHLYKGQDTLIQATSLCAQKGIDIRLVFLGDGKQKYALEALVMKLGLNGKVNFAGQIPAGDAVRSYLDLSDLFILPSRQEGVPRAMVEAMAKGLPCLGSNVGGIPELLPPEDMVDPNNPERLAEKIMEVFSDPRRMEHMSSRNLEQARQYRNEILKERRNAFFNYIKAKMEEWINARQ